MVAKSGCTETIDSQQLLDYKVDVNASCLGGKTPHFVAAQNGHTECVEVLAQGRADLALADRVGVLPVQAAESMGHSSVAEMLALYTFQSSRR